MISFLAPGRNIVLKDPSLADLRQTTVSVSINTMMSGVVRTRRSTPATTALRLTFKEVTRAKTIEMRDFIVATLGEQVRYIDYDGVSWLGYIITEPNSFLTTGRGLGNEARREANEFTIEFEGRKL